MKSFEQLKRERNEQRLEGLTNQLVWFDERLSKAVEEQKKKMEALRELEHDLLMLVADQANLTQERINEVQGKLNKLLSVGYASGGVISANLIVEGSIAAQKIPANAITASCIPAGSHSAVKLEDWRNTANSVVIAGGQVTSNTISTTR